MVSPILMYRSLTCFFANEPDMRSIDIDSCFCLTSFFDEHIEDDLKKFPWPSVNVLSSAPPLLTICRNFLRLRCRRRSFDILAINHSSFFLKEIFFRDLNCSLHFSPLSVTEIVDVDHEVLVVYLKISDQFFFQPHKWSLQLYHKSDIQSHYRKNKIYLIPGVYSA